MSTKHRDKQTPLYIWIRNHNSINNITPSTYLFYRPFGREIVYEVASRYVRLRKSVTASEFQIAVGDMITRYGTRWANLDFDLQTVLSTADPKARVYLKANGNERTQFYTEETEEYEKIKAREARELERRKAEEKKQAVLADPATIIINRFDDSWLNNYRHVGMATVPEVLRDAPNVHEIPAGHPPGVYILMHQNEVVYVGQSINPSARLAMHSKDKLFDRAFLIPTNDLLRVEAEYIAKFKPKYNKTMLFA